MHTVMAIEIATTGGPEVIRAIASPLPVPGRGQVRVRADAIGVSSADLMIRKGQYKWMPPLPTVLGNELAGVIDVVGEGVPSFWLGQRVLVSSRELPHRGGCYVEALCVPIESVFKLPDGVSAEAAVALPNYQLAWALLYASGVQPPSSIAVYGASGGVGLALAQLALAEGISAIGVVSTAEKAAFALGAGITNVLVRGDGFAERMRRLTNNTGVDVIYAHGGADFADNLDYLRPLGTLVSFSPLGGIPDTNLFAALRERMGSSESAWARVWE